jgi:hypothetical protein
VAIIHDAVRTPARSLDASTRRVMEPLFQHDFSDVRVHSDPEAARSAKTLSARAFTIGRDMVFNEGEYSPGTAAGQKLLAHELTHVVQQERGGASSDRVRVQAFSHPHDASEREAAENADRVAVERPLPVRQTASGVVQADGLGPALGIGLGVLGAAGVGLGIAALAGAFDGDTFTDEELKAYLEKLDKDQKIEDASDSDNKAREVVRRWKAGKAGYTVLTVPIRILLINEMASGRLSDDDQTSILDLLQESIPVERARIFPAIKIDTLKGRFDGDQRKKLDALIENQEIETISLTDDWSVTGTKMIVQRHGDAGLLAQVLKLGFKIFRFETGFDKWKYDDGREEENELTGLLGNTDRRSSPKRIRLRKSLHNEQAAATLFHEGTHAISPESKTEAEYLEDEAQARVAEEGFRERHGMEPDDPSYRTAGGKADIAAIRKDVTGSPHYNPKLKKRKRVGRRYVGEQETTGWEA